MAQMAVGRRRLSLIAAMSPKPCPGCLIATKLMFDGQNDPPSFSRSGLLIGDLCVRT